VQNRAEICRPPQRKNGTRSEPVWSLKECLPKPHIVFALCKGLYSPGGVHASLCALHHRGATSRCLPARRLAPRHLLHAPADQLHVSLGFSLLADARQILVGDLIGRRHLRQVQVLHPHPDGVGVAVEGLAIAALDGGLLTIEGDAGLGRQVGAPAGGVGHVLDKDHLPHLADVLAATLDQDDGAGADGHALLFLLGLEGLEEAGVVAGDDGIAVAGDQLGRRVHGGVLGLGLAGEFGIVQREGAELAGFLIPHQGALFVRPHIRHDADALGPDSQGRALEGVGAVGEGGGGVVVIRHGHRDLLGWDGVVAYLNSHVAR